MVSHEITYEVSFRPGRYRCIKQPNPAIKEYYVIGRIDDGVVIGFAFTKAAAELICLGLNLADAQISGNREDSLALLKALDRSRLHS